MGQQLKLPNSISSRQDLTALILEIREYAKWYGHVSVKQQVGVGQMGEPPAVSDAAAEMLAGLNSGQPVTRELLDKLIEDLEEFGNNAPTLSITLAAPASNPLKAQLVGWCRETIAPDILVNFRFNSTLLGGMVIRYGSRIYDWSFRRQILTNRAKFAEVLRRV